MQSCTIIWASVLKYILAVISVAGLGVFLFEIMKIHAGRIAEGYKWGDERPTGEEAGRKNQEMFDRRTELKENKTVNFKAPA